MNAEFHEQKVLTTTATQECKHVEFICRTVSHQVMPEQIKDPTSTEYIYKGITNGGGDSTSRFKGFSVTS